MFSQIIFIKYFFPFKWAEYHNESKTHTYKRTVGLKARNTLCSMVSSEPLQPQPITLTLTYRSSSEGRSQDLTRFPIAIRLLFLFIFNPDKYSVSLLPYSCQNVYPQNQNFKPLIQQNPIRTRGDTGTKQEIDRK